MKHFLIIATYFVVFSVFSQEIEEKAKVKHTFSLSGGIFGQSGTTNFYGATYGLSYQAYFPNRFIFGLNFLTDRANYIRKNGISEFPTFREVTGYAGGVHLGLHVVKSKNIDLSILITPHFNTQEYSSKYYDETEKNYKEQKRTTTYLFVPLISWRIASFYKFNQTHSLGVTGDVNLELEWDGFGDLLYADVFVVGRFMLTYRITLPNR